MRRDHQTTATVTLTGANGSTTCSCRLERDPGYMHYNRMILVGDRRAWVAAFPLQGEGQLTWRLHEDPNWFAQQGARRRNLTAGTAYFRSIGMAAGVAIDPNGIQDFADLDILEITDTHEYGDVADAELCVEYLFLQRPKGWTPYRRSLSFPKGLTHRGDWFTVGLLRCRMVAHGHLRDDRRLSDEVELINLPGFEIAPVDNMTFVDFQREAERLWFCLRILIGFSNRQIALPLGAHWKRQGELSTSWQTLAVRPREVSESHQDGPIRGATAPFFARAAKKLLAIDHHRELLHAAVHGYANSYGTSPLEGRLTSCVEGIERLVGVFESVAGLERVIVGKKAWRTAGATLRGTVDGLGLEPDQAKALRSSLAMPPILRSQDRVERMIHRYRRNWSVNDRALARRLGDLISTRNRIVHGGMIADFSALHAETLCSQTLFELLFLDLVGCHRLGGSGHARWMIRSHDSARGQARVDSGD